jgi:hypothetical protein
VESKRKPEAHSALRLFIIDTRLSYFLYGSLTAERNSLIFRRVELQNSHAGMSVTQLSSITNYQGFAFLPSSRLTASGKSACFATLPTFRLALQSGAQARRSGHRFDDRHPRQKVAIPEAVMTADAAVAIAKGRCRKLQRREDFFLAFFFPGITFFTALLVVLAAALAAFLTEPTARETAVFFFAFLAIVTSWIWIF